MVRPALIGVFAPLLLAGWPAVAGLRAPISGGTPVLPPRFTPMRFEVLGPVPPTAAVHLRGAIADPASAPPPAAWAFPLMDRRLTAAEKAPPLAQELADAISRIEPMYDPSRLDGTGAPPPMAVSAGTAAMNNVFADRWRRADPDPNVDTKVRAIAMAWQDAGVRPCDDFTKARVHGWDDAGLTALTPDDCRALIRYETRAFHRGFGDEPPVPIVAAWISVPVFAAPLPGSRMSSEQFWAARRARIAEIQARLRQRWTAGGMPLAEVRVER